MQSEFFVKNIRLIVGLGNVGKNYINTRHNAGFIFLDELLFALATHNIWHESSKLKCHFAEVTNPFTQDKLVLCKPTTLMNLSGDAVTLVANYFKIKPEEILVAHDDLDIKLGEGKIQFARGPKEHNGISSINERLKTIHYWRLRLGVENRQDKGPNKVPGLRYVLERFSEDELKRFKEGAESIIATKFVLQNTKFQAQNSK